MSEMRQHPLSAAFPSIPQEELQSLAADIKQHGLRSAITLYKGDVLDGWHRYLACGMAGVNPRYIDYKGTDPVAFVRSANWHRRHLSASQRAMVEVSLTDWLPSGRPTETSIKSTVGQEETLLNSRVSAASMATKAGVGTNTIALAKTVMLNGSEQLQNAVKEGDISVNKAAEIAKLPKQDQPAAMQQKPAEKAKLTEPTKEDSDAELLKELEAADQTIRSQQELITSLQDSDAAKEITQWALKWDQLNGRLQQELTTCAEVRKQASYQSDLLAKIRKALKVETNSKILEAIRQ
jgi:ParB-like chromosome segregation protein Spo0J